MPSISKAQAEAEVALAGVGEDRLDAPVELSVLGKIFAQYAAEFKLAIEKYGNQYQFVSNGKLLDNIIPEITSTGNDESLKIRLVNYYDFVDKGVKGVRSSENAPNSPYKFKNYGVPETMRKSLKDYISRGKGVNISNKKYKAIGREVKGRTLEDAKVDRLAYLIKAFGIKPKPYFTKAFDEVFKNVDSVIVDAVGTDILISLNGINLKGK